MRSCWRSQWGSSRSPLQNPNPLSWICLIAREELIEFLGPQVLRRNFGEDAAEIGRQRKVATLVQLLRLETRPPSVDLLAFHVAANHEERARVTVVRAAISVLPRRAAELGHRH